MADELKHKDPGGELTQAEFIATDGHSFDSQAQGDILYATSTTVLSRLGKDANATRALTNTGTNNNPEWEQIALATGVSGTLPVGNGGTGATSLTDGGVLLGSSTSAVTAMAVLADSEMIVGDGTTDPVAESGGTLRTSIGVGTTDSPQFTGIELSHADQNTLTGSGGVLSIQGNRIFHAGGTDVPVADGGTNLSVYAVGDIVYASGTTTLAKLTKGSEDEVLTMGGSNAPTWAAASAGAVTYEGGNTDGSGTYDVGSEAATTSTVAVDLLSATSLLIQPAEPYRIIAPGRKTTGAAGVANFGFKENTTVIFEADSAGQILFTSGSSNAAQSGVGVADVAPRVPNYLDGNFTGTNQSSRSVAGGGVQVNNVTTSSNAAAAHLTGEINTIVIRGETADSLITLGADSLHVYSFAAS